MTELERLRATVRQLELHAIELTEMLKEEREIIDRMSEEWQPGMPDRRRDTVSSDDVANCVIYTITTHYVEVRDWWEHLEFSEREKVLASISGLMK